MDIDKEYETLRSEILQWQSRRFTVATITVGFITALEGCVITNSKQWSWDVASLFVVLLLSNAAYLTRLFSRFNTFIGAYLDVFHGSLWNKRQRKFKEDVKHFNLNHALSLLYMSILIISLCINFAVCDKKPSAFLVSLFVIIFLVLAFLLWQLVFKSYPWIDYLEKWTVVKDQEKIITNNSPIEGQSGHKLRKDVTR